MRNAWFLFIAMLLVSCASISGRVTNLARQRKWNELCVLLKEKKIAGVPQSVYDIAFEDGEEGELHEAATAYSIKFDFLNSGLLAFANVGDPILSSCESLDVNSPVNTPRRAQYDPSASDTGSSSEQE